MNKHATDAVSLAFGVVFLALVAWWLMIRLVEATLPTFGWFLGGVLVLLGGLGVYLSLRGTRGRTPAEVTHQGPFAPGDQLRR